MIVVPIFLVILVITFFTHRKKFIALTNRKIILRPGKSRILHCLFYRDLVLIQSRSGKCIDSAI
jgi:hypothetical protein